MTPFRQLPRREVWIGAAIGAVVIALLFQWHHRVLQHTETLASELREAEGQWTAASAGLDDARRARASFEKFAAKAAEITSACRSFGWAAAMAKGILDAESANIELREIRAGQVTDASATWSLHLAGRAGGARPREIADTFRRKAQSELERNFKGVVTTRFAKMEELPGAEVRPGDEREVAFTILATVERRERAESNDG